MIFKIKKLKLEIKNNYFAHQYLLF